MYELKKMKGIYE